MIATSPARSALRGRQVSNSTTSPEYPAIRVLSVLTTSWEKPSLPESAMRGMISAAVHTPPGRARMMTLRRKRPLTRSRLGCSASTKEGKPMVRELTKVSWMGAKG